MQAFRKSTIALTLSAALVAGCTIPRTGPYWYTIENGSIPVEMVTAPMPIPDNTPREFSMNLRRAGPVNSYLLGPGDVVSIQVWEQSVSPSADGTVGDASISLPRAEVDENGEVFVPFAGRIQAAGRSVSQFHEALTKALAEKLVNPQVSVSRVDAGSMSVNVIGKVGAAGPITLSSANTNLLDVLTRAGGPTEETDLDSKNLKLTLMRGNASETLWLDDVYGDRNNDVALRAGDTVLVQRDERTFTVLGAVKEQKSVKFPRRHTSALRALAEAQGLNDNLADPTGIFVFRPGPEPKVYTLDLNRQDGMMLAGAFELADGDMVYATSAPITAWLKILNSVAPTFSLAGTAYTFTQ